MTNTTTINNTTTQGLVAHYSNTERIALTNGGGQYHYVRTNFLDHLECDVKDIFIPAAVEDVEAYLASGDNSVFSKKLYEVYYLDELLTKKGLSLLKERFMSKIQPETEFNINGVCSCGYKGAYTPALSYHVNTDAERYTLETEDMEELFALWLKFRSIKGESKYTYRAYGTDIEVVMMPCCPSCGNKEFHYFGTRKRLALSVFDNEDSIVLSSICCSHELYTTITTEDGEKKSVRASHNTPFEESNYVYKKEYQRLVTNKRTGRTYLVCPGTKRGPIDVSYTASNFIGSFLPENDEEYKVFHQYINLVLSQALHPVAVEKLASYCMNNTYNGLGAAITMRRIPSLNTLGDNSYDVSSLSPATKKKLREARNKKEAFKALIPAIGKQGMKIVENHGFGHMIFVGAMFKNTDKLNTFLSNFDHGPVNLDDPFGTPCATESCPTMRHHRLSDIYRIGEKPVSAAECQKVLSKFFSQQVLENEMIRYVKKGHLSQLAQTIGDTVSQYKHIQEGLRTLDEEQVAEIREMLGKIEFNNLTQLHDGISSIVRAMKTKKQCIQYTEKEMERFTFSHGEYQFRPAQSNHELVNVGSAMNICVGGYADAALRRDLTILLGFKDNSETPFVCIELNTRNNEFVQVKEKYNNLVHNPLRIEAVKAYAKHAGVKLGCYDTRHFGATLDDVDLSSVSDIEVIAPVQVVQPVNPLPQVPVMAPARPVADDPFGDVMQEEEATVEENIFEALPF